MLPRRLLVCVGLVLALFLERLGFYAARGDLVLYMTRGLEEGGLGMSETTALQTFGQWSGLLYLVPLLGAGVAIFTGPRVPFVLGAVLMPLGYWAVGNVPAGTLMLPLALIALGQGLFKPSLYALAAEELPHPHEGGRNALFLTMFATLNVGATVSSVMSLSLEGTLGHSERFLVLAVLMVVVALVSGGLVALQRFMAQPPPAIPGAYSMKGVGVLLVLALPYMLGQQVVQVVQLPLLQDVTGAQSAMFRSIHPVAVVGLGAVLAAVFAGLVAASRSVPTLPLVGAGLALFAMGGALLVFAQEASATWPLLMLSGVMQALAELLVLPLLYSRVLSGTPRRFAPLVFAGWLLLGALLGNLPFFAAPSFEAQRTVLGLAVVGCAVSAGVIFARWRRVARWFMPPVPPAATEGVLEVR